MKRIIITGSSGFIGKNLTINLLNKKIIVYAILKKSKKNIYLSTKLKKKFNNYKPIFFKNYEELNKNFLKIKADTIINLATYFVEKHQFKDIQKIIESNVLFCSIILELSCKIKIKKFINFGSVWQNFGGKKSNPSNFYAVSKEMFSKLIDYYKNNYKKTKFYTIYLSHTYGNNDTRIKLLPTITKNFLRNKTTHVRIKKLELNIVHVNDVINGILILMKKNIKSSDFILVAKKNIKIHSFIKKINIQLKKKIKIRWLNEKFIKPKYLKMKSIPGWKSMFNIEKEVVNYLDENK